MIITTFATNLLHPSASRLDIRPCPIRQGIIHMFSSIFHRCDSDEDHGALCRNITRRGVLLKSELLPGVGLVSVLPDLLIGSGPDLKRYTCNVSCIELHLSERNAPLRMILIMIRI
jgi:hypothetical protein